MADPLAPYRELMRVTREQLEYADAGDWQSLMLNEQQRINALQALPADPPPQAAALLAELASLTDVLVVQLAHSRAETFSELGRARQQRERASAYGQMSPVIATDLTA